MESSRIGAVTSMAPLRNALSAAVMELLVTPRLSTKLSKYFIGTLAEESMKTTTISPARTAWDEAAFPEPEDDELYTAERCGRVESFSHAQILGGQAGASSRIENYPGFPAGLSGHELAIRICLRSLKFLRTLRRPIFDHPSCSKRTLT